MFLSRNKKNKVYPCKPQFYYIKWGLRGSKLYGYVFVMDVIRRLTTILRENSADDKLMIFFILSQTIGFDNSCKLSKLTFREK